MNTTVVNTTVAASMAPPHAFKVRWKQPIELLEPELSPHSPSLDLQQSCPNFDPDCPHPPFLDLQQNGPNLDPDPDPIIPCIQLRRTQQNILPGIPSYSCLGHHRVILGSRDILVPTPPRVVYFRRSARQSKTVKAQALALLHCTQ